MTTTPTSIPEEGLGGECESLPGRGGRVVYDKDRSMESLTTESWVELGPTSPERTTPLPFAPAEEYLRLLREAQRESNQSSARVSLASSHRTSPKSPPNSPNTELSLEEDLKGVYINYNNKEGEQPGAAGEEQSTDWIWDWSSRPDQIPPKDWKFRHPRRKTLSIRTARVGKVGLFSREMMYTILLTNMLSLILGTGVGVWLSRRSCMIPSIKLD